MPSSILCDLNVTSCFVQHLVIEKCMSLLCHRFIVKQTTLVDNICTQSCLRKVEYSTVEVAQMDAVNQGNWSLVNLVKFRGFCHCWQILLICKGTSLFICQLQNTRTLTMSISVYFLPTNESSLGSFLHSDNVKVIKFVLWKAAPSELVKLDANWPV